MFCAKELFLKYILLKVSFGIIPIPEKTENPTELFVALLYEKVLFPTVSSKEKPPGM